MARKSAVNTETTTTPPDANTNPEDLAAGAPSDGATQDPDVTTTTTTTTTTNTDPEAGSTDAAEELPALYVAKFRICNPFQNFYLHDIPKEIVIDSWWESQIEAGIVIKVQ